jgi:hypothetical protein
MSKRLRREYGVYLGIAFLATQTDGYAAQGPVPEPIV